MKEVELYIPLQTGDSTSIQPAVLESIKQTLLREYGGFTEVTYNRPGAWKMGEAVFYDSVCILRVLDFGSSFDLHTYKAELTRTLHQKEILIVRREVEVL
jgi:hypothetical protein